MELRFEDNTGYDSDLPTVVIRESTGVVIGYCDSQYFEPTAEMNYLDVDEVLELYLKIKD